MTADARLGDCGGGEPVTADARLGDCGGDEPVIAGIHLDVLPAEAGP